MILVFCILFGIFSFLFFVEEMAWRFHNFHSFCCNQSEKLSDSELWRRIGVNLWWKKLTFARVAFLVVFCAKVIAMNISLINVFTFWIVLLRNVLLYSVSLTVVLTFFALATIHKLIECTIFMAGLFLFGITSFLMLIFFLFIFKAISLRQSQFF